jgi:hypothetical protein
MSNPTELLGERMSKEVWIDEATFRLAAYMPEGTREYAENLYQTFVIDFDDPDCTPGDAVDEDLSNWGD